MTENKLFKVKDDFYVQHQFTEGKHYSKFSISSAHEKELRFAEEMIQHIKGFGKGYCAGILAFFHRGQGAPPPKAVCPLKTFAPP